MDNRGGQGGVFVQTILEYEAQTEVLRREIEKCEGAIHQIMTRHETARQRQKDLIAEQGQLIELLGFVLAGDVEGMMRMQGVGDANAGIQQAVSPQDLGALVAPVQEGVPQCKWFSGGPSGVQPENSFAQAAGLPGVSLPMYISTAAVREQLRLCPTASSVLDHLSNAQRTTVPVPSYPVSSQQLPHEALVGGSPNSFIGQQASLNLPSPQDALQLQEVNGVSYTL